MKILGLAMFVTLTVNAQTTFIGNTGLPATTTGHVPFYITGLAADAQGKVYTVSTWDEPHQDVITWDAATGAKLANTGQVQGGVLWNSIGVEPDGSFAYVVGQTNETPAITFRLYKIQLGASPQVVNFTSTGGSILLSSGAAEGKFLVCVNKRYVEVEDPNTGIITWYDKQTGKAGKKRKGLLPGDVIVTSNGYTVYREDISYGAGARLIGQGWEQRCTEFVGCISYSQANPNIFISSSRNLYDRSGNWLGCGIGAVWQEPGTSGPCKVITLGGNDFLYFPYEGQSLAIYRINAGTMKVVTTVLPSTDQVMQSFGVSSDGTLWLTVIFRHLTDQQNCSIWKLPLHGLDSSGNPVYDWADATEVVSQNTILATFGQTDPLSIKMMMANYNAKDSLVYALLYIQSLGPDRGGYWMAGNVLVAFTPDGKLAWDNILPAPAIGMSIIPNGGVILGQNADDSGAWAGGIIHRYSANGALIQTLSPPPVSNSVDLPSGSFDCYGALNAELAPDGLLDIFAEDDFNQRVIWYRTP